MLIKPIPLSDHDLRPMTDEWVSSLMQAQRDELLARALAELRKSLDRLNQNPTKNSKPAPWGTTNGGAEATSALSGKTSMTAPTKNAGGDNKLDWPLPLCQRFLPGCERLLKID
jgi:hypothetical protein